MFIQDMNLKERTTVSWDEKQHEMKFLAWNSEDNFNKEIFLIATIECFSNIKTT